MPESEGGSVLRPADVVEHVRAVAAVLTRWRQSESWFERAACRGLGPDLFFPVAPRADPEAVTACARCPVTEQCAEAGQGERFGVWGGVLHTSGGRREPSPLAAITHRYDVRRPSTRDRRRGVA